MKSFLHRILVCVVVTYSFTACKTTKQNLTYFSIDPRDSSHLTVMQTQAKIHPGDRLAISVTALNPQSAIPYNLNSGATGVSSQNQGISVDPSGRILYPQLGYIQAAGLTKFELRDTLLRRLSTYLTDPVVTVDFLNFKVTVLGEVNKQGPISLGDGSINILEALGMAGDIAYTGRRDSVLVIREQDGKREFGYINLLSNETFKSKFFVLQQNDVVYVPMNDKVTKSENDQIFSRNLQVVTTLVTVVSTLTLLIINLVK